MDTQYTVKLLFIIILFTACKSTPDKYANKTISLSPIKEITMLSDSTFFGAIADLVYADQELYVADNQPQVFQLGSDFKLTGRIDNTGKGPGEFIGIWKLNKTNDSLYIYDQQLSKLLIYDSANKFVREISIPNPMSFVVDFNSMIYISTPAQEQLISVLNANGSNTNMFGDTIKEGNFNIRKNRRLLVLQNQMLLAIPTILPSIEVYNLKGHLLSKNTITHPLIEERIEYVKESYKKGQSSPLKPALFRDVAAAQNKIYLLALTQRNDKMEPGYAIVLTYNINDNGSLTFAHAFKLFPANKDSRLNGFRLTPFGEHKLIVYDLHNKSLLVFEDERL